MSKQLKRYIFLYNQLQEDGGVTNELRNKYEEEIDELYYELNDDDLEYISENELEM